MNKRETNPYTALNKLFHEPSRLAIITALGGAIDGLTFGELKDHCSLTDGNLSRHLKALEDGRMIRVKKSSAGKRTRTSVVLSDFGRQSFMEYLAALEEVLATASKSMAAEAKAADFRVLWKSQFGTGIFDMD